MHSRMLLGGDAKRWHSRLAEAIRGNSPAVDASLNLASTCCLRMTMGDQDSGAIWDGGICVPPIE